MERLTRTQKRTITAAVAGTALELYDFVLYGFFAELLSRLFFPDSDPVMALIAAYGIFAAGFVARPLGALVLGSLGDRIGRKRALEISVLLMSIPTLGMGLLPTHVSIGILAPLLLTLMRLLQGFSLGGELIGAYAYLAENAPEGRRGFMASWSLVGCFLGKALAASAAQLTTLLLTEPQLHSWGWRLPFLGGAVLALIGLALRRSLVETVPHNGGEHSPIKETLQRWKGRIGVVILFTIVHTIGVHLLFIYLPVYLKTQFGLAYSTVFAADLAALLVVVVTLPYAGALSDRIGRRPVMLAGGAALAILIYPAMQLMSHASAPLLVMTWMLLGFSYAVMHGPLSATYMEMFPSRIRQTAAGIAYNATIMLFGGVTPVICSVLIEGTGDPFAPAYFLIAGAVLSCATLVLMREPLNLDEREPFYVKRGSEAITANA